VSGLVLVLVLVLVLALVLVLVLVLRSALVLGRMCVSVYRQSHLRGWEYKTISTHIPIRRMGPLVLTLMLIMMLIMF
jgi:hypothetical protein